MTTARKFKVVTAFGNAAAGYDEAAGLQRAVADRLAERIGRLDIAPNPRVLEIGCGTGFLTRALSPVLPGADWIVSDIAPAMAAQCREAAPDRHAAYLAMDGEAPAVGGGFDLICASLVFQWFENLEASLHRLAALLRPGGHLAFSTLVHGTFREWRAAHRMFGLSAATPAFPSAAAIDGFWPDDDTVAGEGSIDGEALLQTYETAWDFLVTLKTIGAATPAAGRRPLTAGALRKILRHLDRRGALAITYDVAYGIFTRAR